jgi:hypothetical protein
MKREFRKEFKIFVQRVAILGMIGITIPMAIWTGDGTGTMFLALISTPFLFTKEVLW